MNEKLFSVKCYDTASFHVVSTAVSDTIMPTLFLHRETGKCSEKSNKNG